jgi:dolichol-phosphate mannosyltransferase
MTVCTVTLALSIVAPAYNEESCIEEFVEETCRTVGQLGLPYELICVDDGSTDRTGALLLALRDRWSSLRPCTLDGHHGQSAALWAGIAMARGEIIVLMDSDLQNDPADVAVLLARLRVGDDHCVVGVRRVRRDGWLRRVSSRLANRVALLITGCPVTDAGCGLKAARADVLRSLPFFRGAHRFIPTLIGGAGGRVVEVDVNHRPRPRGRSKYGHGLGRTWSALADALGVRWMTSRRLRFAVSEPAARLSPASPRQQDREEHDQQEGRWTAGSF